MKILRIIVLVLFIGVSAVFGLFEYREYQDRDNQAPVITATSDEIVVSVYDDMSAYTKGMSATDNRDGDVTDSIVTTSKSYFITGTTFRMNYVAFDSHNNVGSYSRLVTFSDYTSPRFSINSPMRFSTGSNSYLDNISVYDVIDGDITPQMKMVVQNSYYSTGESSTVPVTLQVTNSFGDIQEITVTASLETSTNYNKPSPALTEYLVYTKVNQGLDLYSYIKGIFSSGKEYTFEEYNYYSADQVQINDSGVDYSVPGTYTVTYMLVNDGTVVGTTDMFVVVEE